MASRREFGDTVGTVFNAITKSGANDLHARGCVPVPSYADERATGPCCLRRCPRPKVNVDSVSGNAGGRIIRNRLFWFAGLEHVKRDLPAVVTVPTATLNQLGLPSNFAEAIPFSQNVTFFLAKVDWQISAGRARLHPLQRPSQ